LQIGFEDVASGLHVTGDGFPFTSPLSARDDDLCCSGHIPSG